MKAKGSSDPLAECKGGGHPKYEKIKDLNAGAFGFVQLCKEKDTGEKVAIKFMERGHKITKVCLCRTCFMGPTLLAMFEVSFHHPAECQKAYCFKGLSSPLA